MDNVLPERGIPAHTQLLDPVAKIGLRLLAATQRSLVQIQPGSPTNHVTEEGIMSYERAYIVCYCKPPESGGGNCACTKCDSPSIQAVCSFYRKSSAHDRCFQLKFDEYCGCFNAADFARGKDIPHHLIPNFTPEVREYIDTPHGLREVKGPPSRREVIYRDQSPYHKKMEEVFKNVRGLTFDELEFDFKDDVEEMSEVMGEFEEWEDALHKNPCKEVTIAVDNSGSMSPERFEELANVVANDLTRMHDKVYPIEKFITPDHIIEIMETLSGAYSVKHRLYLDMSSVNIYTIYKKNGHFISLRDLYRDGIYPMDLNFQMINESTDLEEYGFTPFFEMVPKMLNFGR